MNLDLPSKIFKVTIVCISGLILPLVLLPFVGFIGHTEIIEEIAKAFLIIIFVSFFDFRNTRSVINMALLFGLVFGLSETMFYLSSFVTQGTMNLFWQRLAFTVPLHMITSGILALSVIKRKWMIIIGLILAIVIHVVFNTLIVQISF